MTEIPDLPNEVLVLVGKQLLGGDFSAPTLASLGRASRRFSGVFSPLLYRRVGFSQEIAGYSRPSGLSAFVERVVCDRKRAFLVEQLEILNLEVHGPQVISGTVGLWPSEDFTPGLSSKDVKEKFRRLLDECFGEKEEREACKAFVRHDLNHGRKIALAVATLPNLRSFSLTMTGNEPLVKALGDIDSASTGSLAFSSSLFQKLEHFACMVDSRRQINWPLFSFRTFLKFPSFDRLAGTHVGRIEASCEDGDSGALRTSLSEPIHSRTISLEHVGNIFLSPVLRDSRQLRITGYRVGFKAKEIDTGRLLKQLRQHVSWLKSVDLRNIGSSVLANRSAWPMRFRDFGNLEVLCLPFPFVFGEESFSIEASTQADTEARSEDPSEEGPSEIGDGSRDSRALIRAVPRSIEWLQVSDIRCVRQMERLDQGLLEMIKRKEDRFPHLCGIILTAVRSMGQSPNFWPTMEGSLTLASHLNVHVYTDEREYTDSFAQ